MPLVFAGVCSHAPGITGRANLADPVVRDDFAPHLLDPQLAVLEVGSRRGKPLGADFGGRLPLRVAHCFSLRSQLAAREKEGDSAPGVDFRQTFCIHKH